MAEKKEQTADEFIDKFDNFRRVPGSNSVVIHPSLPYNLIELKETFVDELKRDLSTKIALAKHGVDELSPTEKFVIMLLQDAY